MSGVEDGAKNSSLIYVAISFTTNSGLSLMSTYLVGHNLFVAVTRRDHCKRAKLCCLFDVLPPVRLNATLVHLLQLLARPRPPPRQHAPRCR